MKHARSGASFVVLAFCLSSAANAAGGAGDTIKLAQGPSSGQSGTVVQIPPGRPTVTSPPPLVQTPPPPAATPAGAPAAQPATPIAGGKRIEIVVPFKERTLYIGDVSIAVTVKGEMVDMPLDRVLQLLAPIASPSMLDRVKAVAANRARITIGDLQTAGLKAAYDPALLEITVEVPIEDKQRRTLELASLDREDRGQFSPQSKISGWLTWRTAFDYIEKGPNTGLADPAFDLSSALRFGSWALENEAFVDTADTENKKFSRLGTRLVRDWPTSAMRLTIGDMTPFGRGYQTSPQMAGISLLQSYSSIQPGRNIRPSGQGAFALREPGTVEVYVNGRMVRRMDLDSGTYDVRDFPFTAGQNNIQFVVQDRTGRRELFAYNQFFDQSLLKAGLTEYLAAVGVESPMRNGEPDYSGRGVFTGYYRRGVNDDLTLGANLQGDKDNRLYGVEAVWANRLGILAFQGAASEGKAGTGTAFLMSFQRQNNPGPEEARQSFAFTAEARSRNFGGLNTATVINLTPGTPTAPNAGQNRTALDLAANYTRDISRDTNLSFDLGYSFGRDGQKDAGRARAALARRVGFDTSVGFEVRWDERGFGQGEDFGVLVTLNRRLGRDQSVRAFYDSAEKRTSVAWQRTPRDPYGEWSLSADVQNAPDGTAFNATAYRQFNRVETSLAQVAATDGSGKITDVRSSLRLAGSIAFADGTWALGRPIYDSFAIVKPHASLADRSVVVDQQPKGDAAHTGAFGPALVPDLSAYSRRTLVVGVKDLPPGYDLGSGTFDLLPGYHGAYVLEVGSAYSVTAIGSLVDSDGQPLALTAGKAFDLADPSHAPVEVFTNRQGRFAAQGLRPGRWRLEMGASSPVIYVIDINTTDGTLVRIPQPVRPSAEARK
ncbi:MAG: fimbrial biogenesis outer membrane usher protein [Caulobacteraceae bacterium]|nr:fimbrial biogenesis outer membrane usher protein [Caulobacteraceae bacterium]